MFTFLEVWPYATSQKKIKQNPIIKNPEKNTDWL